MMPVSAARPSVRVLSCPNCGGSVNVRAAGLSVSAICASCGSTIDVADENLKIISGATARTIDPPIPIGTRAVLAGSQWEVIGFQHRRDPDELSTGDDDESWDEYLLFNPYEGFRFLATGDDDWTLYSLLRQDVTDPSRGAGDGRRYRSNGSGRARTEYVLGEFYWRVHVGEEVETADFVAEPYVLSREASAGEIVWSRGIRLSSATVERSFRLTAPAAATPAPTDAMSVRQRATRSVMRTFWIALAALALAELVPFGQGQNATVYSHRFAIDRADSGHYMMSAPFTVPGVGGSLWIGVTAPVRNSWVQLDLSLVNQADEHSFDAKLPIEAYDGMDSDGSWSEGGQDNEVLFASVPGGVYRLLIDVDSQGLHGAPSVDASDGEGAIDNAASFAVDVRRHARSHWNLVFALLVLAPYPVWRYLSDRSSGTAKAGRR